VRSATPVQGVAINRRNTRSGLNRALRAGTWSVGAAVALFVAVTMLPPTIGRGAPAPTRPNVYVAVNGNDSTCKRASAASPCASFGRAYAIAKGGDVVGVAAGSYPSQSIVAVGAKTAAVTIEPLPSASVSVQSLSIAASHVHVVGIVASGQGDARGGLDICDTECVPSLTDVLVQGFRGKYAFIRASNVTIKGGEYGDFDACLAQNPEDGFRLWGGSVVPQPVNDVLDGVTIHDVGSGEGNTCEGTVHEGYHVDCLQTQGGVGIVIRNSLFYNCPTSDIQAEPFSGAVQSNWLIQNNVFGPTACCNSIVLTQASPGGDCSSFVVRYNVIEKPPNDVYCDGGPLQLYGNIFTANVSSCNRNSDEAYNVYPARNTATCRGKGNRKCNPAFVAPSADPPNYALLPTDRCARGAGDPTRYPQVDRTGRKRPQGTLPDAGPYEVPVVPKRHKH
jgi:hypothetical protein